MAIVAHAPPLSFEARLKRRDDDALERWRVAHRASVEHLKRCLDCAIELCPAGQALWDVANEAERALPWRTWSGQ